MKEKKERRHQHIEHHCIPHIVLQSGNLKGKLMEITIGLL